MIVVIKVNLGDEKPKRNLNWALADILRSNSVGDIDLDTLSYSAGSANITEAPGCWEMEPLNAAAPETQGGWHV